MTLLTPTERLRLELIRDRDTAGTWEGNIWAIGKGWAERAGKTLKLTEPGIKALQSDDDDQMAARGAQRPRRR